MIEGKANPARRAVRHEFDDGIWEMVSGGWLSGLGLILGSWVILPHGMPWIGLWVTGSLLALTLGLVAGLKTARSLKVKWTCPRAGFVSSKKLPDPARRSRIFWMVALQAAVYGGVGPLLRSTIHSMTGLILFYSTLAAIVLLLFAARTGIGRFLIVSAVVFAAGIGLAFTPLDDLIKLALGPIATGAILFISGRVALSRFIERNEEMAL